MAWCGGLLSAPPLPDLRSSTRFHLTIWSSASPRTNAAIAAMASDGSGSSSARQSAVRCASRIDCTTDHRLIAITVGGEAIPTSANGSQRSSERPGITLSVKTTTIAINGRNGRSAIVAQDIKGDEPWGGAMGIRRISVVQSHGQVLPRSPRPLCRKWALYFGSTGTGGGVAQRSTNKCDLPFSSSSSSVLVVPAASSIESQVRPPS